MEALGCDINDVERAIQIYRYNKTKRAFSRSQTPAECFYTFNWLMDCELKNIIRIIEGIRYSLTARDISEMLIS